MTREKIGTLWIWPERGGGWRYLPLAPVPQRNEAGRAMVTVIEAGGTVMLTIGARLAADEADLALARKAIATRDGTAEAGVDLRPAEARVETAELVLRDAAGAESVLATARPSTLPPYSAALSAMLQGAAAEAVKEALPAGRVTVRYRLGLACRLAATAQLSGPWDGSGDVDTALARGDLRLRVTADSGVSKALVQRATDRARAEAGRRLSMQGGCTAVEARSGTFVEVTETEVVEDREAPEAAVSDLIT